MEKKVFEKKRITDLESKECSGCGLCENVCPQGCITMSEDSLGYKRPFIEDSNCIDCGLCSKQCIMLHPIETVTPITTSAAVRSDKEKIILSSSGGVFASIAEQLISKGWMVAGCIIDTNLNPRHILTENIQELRRMYGSKYVQSDTSDIYELVKDAIMKGRKVLFSGTPCQVAAVKRYTKGNDNLLTIEVICHGVPNVKMFHSSLALFNKAPIKDFLFRDKGQGWTFNNLVIYKDGSVKKVNHRLSSYMTYFLKGETYRDSCYECPYARPERGADITLGDFWGVVGRRGDLKDKIDIEKGVSCLLVNSGKGEKVIEFSNIDQYKVSYEDIKCGNEPLNHPSIHTDKRSAILAEWRKKHSWAEVNRYWKKNDFKLSYLIWSYIPPKLQHKIRLLLKKR